MPTKTNQQIEVIIFRHTADGPRFLMLKRNPQKGGFWQPITGGVHEGESLEDAAFREIREETGLAEIRRLIDTNYSFAFFDDNRQQQERVYGAEVAPETTITLSPEHTEYCWVAKEEALTRYLKWPGNKQGFQALCTLLGI